jgi:Tetratricopeptide repeat
MNPLYPLLRAFGSGRAAHESSRLMARLEIFEPGLQLDPARPVRAGKSRGSARARSGRAGRLASRPGSIATLYQHQGKWNDAVILGENVLEATRRSPGPENPDTLLAMANVVWIYQPQEHRKMHSFLGEKVLEASRRLPGPEHPRILLRTSSLGQTYQIKEDSMMRSGCLRKHQKSKRGSQGMKIVIHCQRSLGWREHTGMSGDSSIHSDCSKKS